MGASLFQQEKVSLYQMWWRLGKVKESSLQLNGLRILLYSILINLCFKKTCFKDVPFIVCRMQENKKQNKTKKLVT